MKIILKFRGRALVGKFYIFFDFFGFAKTFEKTDLAKSISFRSNLRSSCPERCQVLLYHRPTCDILRTEKDGKGACNGRSDSGAQLRQFDFGALERDPDLDGAVLVAELESVFGG